MALARSKVTSQGQISVPAAVRKRLGVHPGSTLEWNEAADGTVTVRRVGRYTSMDIHRVLFPEGPPKRAATVEEMDEAIGEYLKQKYERSRH